MQTQIRSSSLLCKPLFLGGYSRQEAIAYFPLILLASGLCGTAIAKVLNMRLGSKVSGR